jgi:hypothetical protein
MKERLILFNGSMVRAILGGTKTQTRRAINPQPERCELGGFVTTDRKGKRWAHGLGSNEAGTRRNFASRSPYGQPGDRLWVRETWKYSDWTEDGLPWITYSADASERIASAIQYDSDGWGERVGEIWAELSRPENYDIDGRAADRRWRPSIHMPRWASRILLEIVSVRVERLQDISEADARAEGVTIEERHMSGYCAGEFLPSAIRAYRELWESINGAGSWEANCWVWVVEFKRVTP